MFAYPKFFSRHAPHNINVYNDLFFPILQMKWIGQEQIVN